MKSNLIIATAALLAAGACTGSVDPQTATVFDNIRNINSGEYDRQIAVKEAEAAAIVQANDARRSNIASLDQQRQANAGQIAALRSEIAAVQAEIARARAAGADAAQIDRLSSQVNAVQADASGGADATVVRSELSRIRAAVRALSA